MTIPMLDLPRGVRGGGDLRPCLSPPKLLFTLPAGKTFPRRRQRAGCIKKKQGIDRRVFLFGDHIGFRGCRENRKIMRRPGLRLVAGAVPLNQAILILERDLMQLAKTPAKLKKSIFRTAVFRQSLRIYVTYGDLERRYWGMYSTRDRVGT
jgi:hypothetical protein